MGEANLVALKGLYERWAVGDWGDTSFFDPHLVGVFPDPSPRAYYGVDAVAQYTRSFLEPWQQIKVEARHFRQIESSYVVEVQIRGKGRSSGVDLEDQLFHVWTFRGDRAIRFDVFQSIADALAAAGGQRR